MNWLIVLGFVVVVVLVAREIAFSRRVNRARRELDRLGWKYRGGYVAFGAGESPLFSAEYANGDRRVEVFSSSADRTVLVALERVRALGVA